MSGSYSKKTNVKLAVSFFLSMVVATNSLPMPIGSAASYPRPAKLEAELPESDQKDFSTAKVHGSRKSSDDKVRGPEPEADKRVKATLAQLPLSFEINRGQADAEARFLTRGNGYSLYLTDSESVLVFGKAAADKGKSRLGINRSHSRNTPSAVVKLRLAGSKKHPRITGLEELSGKSNYFIG